MGLDLRPTCSKCGKTMELTEIKAVGPNEYMCTSCYEGPSASPRGVPASSAESFRAGAIAPVASGEGQFFENKEYICNACGFKFTREPTKAVSRCPYCGKDAVREKVDTPADDFVQ